jgi:hypothetical protein
MKPLPYISGLTFLLTASLASSEMSIRLELDHSTIIQHEPALAFITLSNIAEEPFILPARGGSDAKIDFIVRQLRGDRVSRLTDQPIVPKVTILPGETKRRMVDISLFYDLQQMGGYIIHVEVHHDGSRFGTDLQYFDIVGGLPLSSARYPVPDLAKTYRNFQLSYLARERKEILFLSVTEAPSGKHFQVMALGRLMRVYAPVISLDRDGHVRVSHQSAPETVTRSTLRNDKKGIELIDQKYERLRGHVGADGAWTTGK